MRILTLNTWKCDGAYRQRLQAMAQGLAALAPDVILLQEVFATEDGRADTAGYLAQALSMWATRAPARRKVRAFEGESVMSSSGLAVLTRGPLVAHQVVPLPTDPADGERIAQLACLQRGGVRTWLANVHLTHLDGASDLRIRQLNTGLTALRHLAADDRCVLGGDFNCSPGGPEFEVLRAGPSPWVMPAGSQIKSTHRTSDGRDLDLDHLLLSGGSFTCVPPVTVVLDPRQTQAGQEASDHAAVMLDLAILHS